MTSPTFDPQCVNLELHREAMQAYERSNFLDKPGTKAYKANLKAAYDIELKVVENLRQLPGKPEQKEPFWSLFHRSLAVIANKLGWADKVGYWAEEALIATIDPEIRDGLYRLLGEARPEKLRKRLMQKIDLMNWKTRCFKDMAPEDHTPHNVVACTSEISEMIDALKANLGLPDERERIEDAKVRILGSRIKALFELEQNENDAEKREMLQDWIVEEVSKYANLELIYPRSKDIYIPLTVVLCRDLVREKKNLSSSIPLIISKAIDYINQISSNTESSDEKFILSVSMVNLGYLSVSIGQFETATQIMSRIDCDYFQKYKRTSTHKIMVEQNQFLYAYTALLVGEHEIRDARFPVAIAFLEQVQKWLVDVRAEREMRLLLRSTALLNRAYIYADLLQWDMVSSFANEASRLFDGPNTATGFVLMYGAGAYHAEVARIKEQAQTLIGLATKKQMPPPEFLDSIKLPEDLFALLAKAASRIP